MYAHNLYKSGKQIVKRSIFGFSLRRLFEVLCVGVCCHFIINPHIFGILP